MLHELSQLEIAWIELVQLQQRFQLQILSFSTSNLDFLTKTKLFLDFEPVKDLEMTMNTPMAPSLSEIALNNFKNDMNSLPVELPALNRAATQA